MTPDPKVPTKLRTTVDRRTLAEQVYSSLKKAIVSGDLRPGQRLKEVELAGLFGASRTPVREALAWLERERLVTPLPFVGLTVAELSETDVREIFGLLRVLETYALHQAAERITGTQIEKLKSICERAEELAEAGDERISELNWKFHELLVEASGNHRLREIIKNLRDSMQPYRAVTLSSTAFRKRSVSDHREIVALLCRKATDRLEALMNEHFEIAQNVTVAGLRERATRLTSEEFAQTSDRSPGTTRRQHDSSSK